MSSLYAVRLGSKLDEEVKRFITTLDSLHPSKVATNTVEFGNKEVWQKFDGSMQTTK